MKLKLARFCVAALALAACAPTAKPLETPLQVVKENASIPFVNFGGIRSWSARDDGSLLIEGTTGRFYRATFMNDCPELKFAVPGLAITSNPSGDTDRFSSILVNGRTCHFATLDEVIDPKSRATPAPSAPVDGAALPPPR